MAKKPTEKSKKILPQASKVTKHMIAYVKDKKPIGDILNDSPKKLVLSPTAGQTPRKPLFEGAFKWIEGKGHYFVLGATTAAICAVIYWMMVQ